MEVVTWSRLLEAGLCQPAAALLCSASGLWAPAGARGAGCTAASGAESPLHPPVLWGRKDRSAGGPLLQTVSNGGRAQPQLGGFGAAVLSSASPWGGFSRLGGRGGGLLKGTAVCTHQLGQKEP